MVNRHHRSIKWLTSPLYAMSAFLIFLLFHQVIRFLFLVTYFDGPVTQEGLFQIFKWGFRFDVQLICLLAIPVFIIWLILEILGKNKSLYKFLFVSILLFQLPGLLLNIFDWIYYKHALRRSGVEVIYLIGPGLKFAGGIWKMYQYELIAGLLLLLACCLLVWFVIKAADVALRQQSSGLRLTSVLLLLIVCLTASGIFQRRPLIPSSPLLEIPSNWLVFSQNSGNNFIYSLYRGNQKLMKPAWFEDVNPGHIPVQKNYSQSRNFDSANIVVFVLESVNAAELDPNNKRKAYTPFLDSLRRLSINCRNTIANGFQSNQGMVALFGGLPPFLATPVYNSIYNSNRFDGIGNLLSRKGYSGFFALGAERDHFGFEKWMRMIGARYFFNKETIGKGGPEDGNWGVFDHYFIPSLVNDIDTLKQPFWGGICNLSSHPPFTLPKQWKSRAPQKQYPYQASIEYVDYSLRLFFEKARKSDWFSNTYFLFISDHALAHDQVDAGNWVIRTSIPFFIYHPSFRRSLDLDAQCQQLDLLPTVLDLLNYDQSFFSFGESILRRGNRYAYSLVDDNLHVYDDDIRLEMNLNSGQSTSLHFYKKDSLLKHNRLEEYPDRAHQLNDAGKALYYRYYQYLTGISR